MFLGRVVEADEPVWLPEDRDMVDLVSEFDKSRNACGHWDWQAEDVESLEPGYQVCAMCAEMGPYEDKIRKQNRDRQRDEHGLTFGWYPPRQEDSDGD